MPPAPTPSFDLSALARRLATWWLAEVATWLPADWRPDAKPRLIARWTGERLDLWEAGGPALSGTLTSGRARRGSPVMLSLGAGGRALSREITLPASAAAHLRQVVGHQLDRWTPWDTDQAWFEARVGRVLNTGEIAVTLTALPRAAAESALRAAEALGLHPTLIEAQDAAGERVLLPVDGGTRNLTRRRLILAAAAAPVVALSLAVGAEWVALLVAEHDADTARGDAVAVRRLSERVEARKRALAFADTRKEAAASPTVVLEALSRLLPDDTFISEMRLDQNALLLLGRSANASRLPALLSASIHFADVRFSAAVVRGPDGTDQFQLSARVVPHGEP